MMLKETPVKTIMTVKPVTVQINEAFSHVEEKLRKNRIRHLPVVDAEGKLIGVITERDLYRAVSPRETDDGFYYEKSQLDSFLLRHYMTHNPLSLFPESTMEEAVDLMAERKFGCIPIVDHDKTLVGIITQIDILKFFSNWFHAH